MAVAIVNAPRGKRSSIRVTDINLDDDGTTKIGGLVSTRNQGDTSMYVPVANATAGTERGFIIAHDAQANAGGYFDSLYVNVKASGTQTGEYRAIEAKASVTGDLAAGAIATGVYAKVAAANASEVAKAIGVDVLLEETGSGAITEGVGVRVQGGVGCIDHAIDVSGAYRRGSVKMPYKAAAAAASAAQFATSFGITEGALTADTCIVGIYNNTGGSMYLVVKVEGIYKHIELVDAS